MQDPRKRATADEVLQHQWMKEHGTASSAPLDNVILRRMQGWSYISILEEYARFAGEKMADEQVRRPQTPLTQFIEVFDLAQVRLDPAHQPAWL